ncbi:Imm70 family immunity protein [Janthinobacterium sp. J1-1]|uniref:Imm70 family immunity protein n=1 Tax=unclassified Janthinobacterium TaxID=2610881 RepID=UPI002810BA8F|nr:Imm70 family immunity protein [Janthinobacterium sp. J1-1]
MTIAFRHGAVITEIGINVVLHSLLSTVAVRLEGGEWGARFPLIMIKLYQGRLDAPDADTALLELRQIRAGLATLAPAELIWDFNDLSRQPPWGDAVAPRTTSMADYHTTNASRNLLDEMLACVTALKDGGGVLEIIALEGMAPFYYVS